MVEPCRQGRSTSKPFPQGAGRARRRIQGISTPLRLSLAAKRSRDVHPPPPSRGNPRWEARTIQEKTRLRQPASPRATQVNRLWRAGRPFDQTPFDRFGKLKVGKLKIYDRTSRGTMRRSPAGVGKEKRIPQTRSTARSVRNLSRRSLGEVGSAITNPCLPGRRQEGRQAKSPESAPETP